MQDVKTLLSMIKKLKYILPSKRRKQCIILFIIIFVGALFELLGVTAILPFIQAVLQPETLMNNKYIRPLTGFFHIINSKQLITAIGIAIILIYLVKNLYLLWSKYMQIRFRNGLQKELSTKLLRSFMRRPYTYFLDANSGNIIRGLTGDVDSINSVLDSMFKFLVEGLSCALISVYILTTDVLMAMGILLIAGACFLLVTFSFKRKISSAGEKQRQAQVSKSIYAYQSITGIKEIMVAQKNDFFVQSYEEACEDVRRTSVFYEFIGACPERIIEAVCISGIIGMVCVRLRLGVAPEMFVPQLGAFAVAAFRMLPSISRMIGDINNIIFLRYSLEVVYRNFVESEQYVEYLEEYNRVHSKAVGLEEKRQYIFEQQIILKNIWWKYPNVEEYVLKRLNLTIHKGEAIGLIGASGAGKTTLADVILGLLRPQKGNIYMDDTDILTIPVEWSKIIGYVPQSVFLTDDTIRNNVTFGIELEDIDDQCVWQALDQAQMKEFVEQLPKGLETIVGERGIKFSGGQRQRIAIARALYSNPDILVLDEATSALDKETETAVMEAIEALQGHKTLIIVAHRLTTIRNCDKIYEIANGQAYLREKSQVLQENSKVSEET